MWEGIPNNKQWIMPLSIMKKRIVPLSHYASDATCFLTRRFHRLDQGPQVQQSLSLSLSFSFSDELGPTISI